MASFPDNEGPLGRLPAGDSVHIEKYPLTAGEIPRGPTPVVIGIDWDGSYDRPVKDSDGSYWIGRTPRKGIRGGHAVCLKPPALVDLDAWWRFFDQGREGACVAAATCRMMTLLNRRRYDMFPVYAWAQANDEFASTPPASGTSVRAGMDCARKVGMWRVRAGVTAATPTIKDGLQENRWAMSVEDIAACLAGDGVSADTILNAGYVVMLNSWATRYPHYTRMPLEELHRVIYDQVGDATVVTDLVQP